MAKNLAIITARGGSKRIPKKNIKNFFGKPVIAYTIQSALESRIFDKVIVSTDCNEIAQIARQYGAEIPFMRSKKNSNDSASTADVLFEVLQEYKKVNFLPKYACCIYPVAPLLLKNHYQQAYKKLIENNFDSTFAITKYPAPIEWALEKSGKKIFSTNKESLALRSQDIKEKYYDAGQFYFFDVFRFLSYKSIITNNSGWIEMNSLECQDVDNLDDWNMLEAKWLARSIKKGQQE